MKDDVQWSSSRLASIAIAAAAAAATLCALNAFNEKRLPGEI
jgi:hypothetical protein